MSTSTNWNQPHLPSISHPRTATTRWKTSGRLLNHLTILLTEVFNDCSETNSDVITRNCRLLPLFVEIVFVIFVYILLLVFCVIKLWQLQYPRTTEVYIKQRMKCDCGQAKVEHFLLPAGGWRCDLEAPSSRWTKNIRCRSFFWKFFWTVNLTHYSKAMLSVQGASNLFTAMQTFCLYTV